jgi:hypothetical protein
MKKLALFVTLFAVIGLALVTLNVQKVSTVSASACVQANGECDINSNDKVCCGGLTCVLNNIHSDNGKCQPATSPTPTQGVTPTPTQGVTPTPTSGVTPTPTVICNADHDCVPTATPTPTSGVTSTPPPAPNGDGKSDGRSDGGSSCPQCTQAPIQAVLGASTMADTGAFDTNVMNFVLLGGMLSMGAAAYAKAKKA